jgi:hypothetical protein
VKNITKSLVFLCLAVVRLQAGGLENIKGTYTPLIDEYKQCAPMHGAIFWEHPYLLKNLYLYGEIPLFKDLFYVAQGLFIDTGLERKPAYHFSPEIIGKIVAALELSEEKLGAIKNKKAQEIYFGILKKTLLDEIKTIVKQDEYFQTSIKKTDEARALLGAEILALKEKLSNSGISNPDKSIILEQIQKKQILIRQKETDVAQTTALDDLASNIFNLFKDCFFDRQIPHLTTYLLLAFLYKKDFAKGGAVLPDREKFKRYFIALEDYIYRHTKDNFYRAKDINEKNLLRARVNRLASDGIFQPKKNPFRYDTSRKVDWMREYYDISQVGKIRTRIESFVEDNENSQDLVGDLLKAVPCEDIVYAEATNKLYMGRLPKIADFKWGVRYKDKDFSDCIETVVRNLCNIFLYDQTKGVFDLSKVPNVSKSLKFFYQKTLNKNEIANPKNVNLKTLNDDWTQVVENVDGVVYRRLEKVGSPVVFSHSLIRIDDKIFKSLGSIKQEESPLSDAIKQITIEKKKYDRVISQDYFLFEIMPSLRNIIVLLNVLFGLNLYADQKVIFDKKFNSTYFPKLCDKLGWKYEGEEDLNKDVGITIPIIVEQSSLEPQVSFDIDIRSGHGEITDTMELEPQEYEEVLFENIGTKKSNYIPLVLLYNNYLPFFFDVLKEDILFGYNKFPLFCTDLNDFNKLAFITDVLDESNPAGTNIIKNFIKNTPLVGDLYFHRDLVKKLKGEEAFFKKELGIVFNNLIKSDSVNFDKDSQLNLLRELLDMRVGDHFDQVIKLAYEGVLGGQNSAALLFEALFKQGYGFDDAMDVASKCYKREEESVRGLAFFLFRKIVEYERHYTRILGVANDATNSNDPAVRLLALNLFEALVAKGQAYRETIIAVGKCFQSGNDDEVMKAFDLYQKLVEIVAAHKNKDLATVEELIALAQNSKIYQKIQKDQKLKIKVDELKIFATKMKDQKN